MSTIPTEAAHALHRRLKPHLECVEPSCPLGTQRCRRQPSGNPPVTRQCPAAEFLVEVCFLALVATGIAASEPEDLAAAAELEQPALPSSGELAPAQSASPLEAPADPVGLAFAEAAAWLAAVLRRLFRS